MSYYLRGIIVGGLAGLTFVMGANARAQQLYNYQTGQVDSQTSQQTYYDDQNYQAGNAPKKHIYSGNWSLTLGASVYEAPEYQGADTYQLMVKPLVSLGKTGAGPRFSSRNDNISFALLERSLFRFGLTGKILNERDGDTSDDLRGLKKVKWGGELGGFAEIYPVDWLRVRGELRHGVRTHDAVTADLAIDAFNDVTPTIRLSGGPRAFYATKDYFKTYYGVNAEESFRSGLKQFHPDSGFGSLGLGGAVTWKTTDKITTSVFGEYSRLTGDAGDSSLVDQRGDKNQFTMGLSATYRFDFSMK
ncbi:MipA/OmpV family protein [Bartonella sp. LJL80]